MTRNLLKTILLASIALISAGDGARADARTLAEKWAEVEANAAIFRESAGRMGLSSSWTTDAPIRLTFDPPATEEQVLRAEYNLGAPLPDGLRDFFTEASAGVHILWLIPGDIETLPGGLSSVRYRILPPSPWRKDAIGGGRTVPVINGGVLSFSLDAIAGLSVRSRIWKRLFRREAESAKDAALAKHYLRYADFWDRGLPVSSDGSGGILAVDRDDPEGRLLFLRHDGDDAPGWFLDMTLIDFMVTQSRLGFPGIGEQELLAFSRTDASAQSMAAAYAGEYGEEALEFELSLPISRRMDTDVPGADIWRAWLGL